MDMILIEKIFMLFTITFYYAYAVCYIVICVNGRYSLFTIYNFILIVLPRLYTTEGGSSILNLSGKRFFTLSKWKSELRLM